MLAKDYYTGKTLERLYLKSETINSFITLVEKIKQRYEIKLLEKWYQKWETLLKEKTINQNTKKWFYTHKKLRSAYRSLKTNLPYLFTYQEKQNRHLKIPNTTNLLDGFFSHLKDTLRVHRGLNIKRKIKIIETIIWR
jgi:hypothetical protein